jgi:octaheme c-type cytochrome (tetrathionate reductase family)
MQCVVRAGWSPPARFWLRKPNRNPNPLKLTTTADHTKFKELQKQFNSGPEVTKACLACHTEAAGQIHRTKHWKWEYLNPDTKQTCWARRRSSTTSAFRSPRTTPPAPVATSATAGKTPTSTSSPKRTSIAWLCHDTSGNYKKPPGLAGNVVTKDMEFPPGSGKILKAIDLSKIAQKVGKTSRDTCGACHFNGGGGDGVKHGDMDSSLAAPTKDVDIHMDAEGLDFTCGTCHTSSSHDVAGSRYTPTAQDKKGAHMRGKADKGNPATCVACHGNGPHKKEARLNQHANKIACQTCHIPTYARGGIATKMTWDWSTAGKRDAEGKHITKKDAKGRITYESRKGDFTLAENVKPEYAWFNGNVQYTLLGDKIEKTEQRTQINKMGGSPTDGKSMIWPMKVFRGSQPYDPVNKTLITPHTAGNDDTGFWKNLDWDKAIPVGMKDSGAPYSGKFDFIKTEMSWPITHMVAPKEKAHGLRRMPCKDGRLAGIKGVYLPVRDNNKLVDTAGWTIVLLTLLGVIGHGTLRIVTAPQALRSTENG